MTDQHVIETEPPSVVNPASVSLRYRWAVVGMLWFICFLNYADRVAISSVLPELQRLYHFTKSEQGMILAAFTWTYALAAPFAGHVGDRGARKTVILGGLYIWSLVTGFTAVCAKVWQFVLVRGTEGLGETFYMPASMALIADYHAPATRSRAIGLHQTSIYAGSIFGGAIAGFMAQRFGWRSPFVFLAIAGMLLGLVLNAFIREPRRNFAEIETREGEGANEEVEHIPIGRFLVEFFRTPTAVLLITAYMGANVVGVVLLMWMPTFLKEKYHLPLGLAGLGGMFFVQVGSMIGAGLGGVAADRWVRVRLDGRIRVQALATLAGAPFLFLVGWTTNGLILIIALTIAGLTKGMYDANLTSAFYDVIAPARRGTATGLMNFVGWLAAGVGTYLVGAVVDHGVTMSAAISSTSLLFLGVAAILAVASAICAPQDIVRLRR